MTRRLEAARTGLAIVTLVAMIAALFVVFGTERARAVSASCATSQNWQSFTFVFENGHVFSGDNCPGSPYAAEQDGNSQEAFLPGTGGATSDLDGPGMQLHTSCSEVYEAGWGSDGNQPDQNVDTAWKLASFHIDKFHNDNAEPHTSCDQPWTPPTTTTTTSTTVPEPTTTTTSTTVPEPTTTTTSTTVPEPTTTTTSTTVPEPTTTTTVPESTTTTILGTTITSPTSTLPFTGLESDRMAGLAIALIGSGILLTIAGKGRREEA